MPRKRMPARLYHSIVHNNRRPVTARRIKNRALTASNPVERVERLKTNLSPTVFFMDELPGLELKQDSGWIDGKLCPFHDDRHAGSFKINLDSGAFRCFACGAAGGDIVAFYRLRYGMDFMTALADLEGRMGL